MSALDTIKAITTNLESIIETTLTWSLEDKSSGDGTAAAPIVNILYDGEEPEDLFNERSSYIEADFTFKISFAGTGTYTPALARIDQQTNAHALRAAITVALLNVGDLSASKLVSFVEHGKWEVDYDTPPLSVITYPITVRYREN